MYRTCCCVMYVILFQKDFLLNCYFKVDSGIVEFDFSKVYITISVHVLVDTLLNYFNQITIL